MSKTGLGPALTESNVTFAKAYVMYSCEIASAKRDYIYDYSCEKRDYCCEIASAKE